MFMGRPWRYSGPRGEASVLLVLNSFRAEGTPRLALDLCRHWLEWGLYPIILSLERAEADLRAEFDSLGLPLHTTRYRESGVGRYVKLVSCVYQVCRRHRARAMLCMTPGLHSFAAMGARLAGASGVATHVGNPAIWSFKAQSIIGIGRPFTTSLVCCSEYVRETVIDCWKVRRSETSVIYNGVNVETFDSTRRLIGKKNPYTTEDDRPVIVGMVGTLETHKDQATLIRAAKLLQDKGMRLEVRLIGDGSQRASLERLASELSAPVRFMGSRDNVATELAALDVFVFSTTEQEGLGIALIEAMYCGLPIVASDVQACREVLDNGRAGLLVKAGTALGLAEAVEQSMRQRKEASERVKYAQSRVQRVFSSRAMAQAYAELLSLPVTLGTHPVSGH